MISIKFRWNMIEATESEQLCLEQRIKKCQKYKTC